MQGGPRWREWQREGRGCALRRHSAQRRRRHVRTVGHGWLSRPMGVADELPDDALEEAFPVGHEGGLERGKVTHLTAARQFHGVASIGTLVNLSFLVNSRFPPCSAGNLFHVAILAPLAADRVVVFEGETQGIDLGMAAGSSFRAVGA